MIERLLAKIAAAFSHNRDRLRDKLYGHYMASALLPILFIEVTLLIVYFAMASIVTGEQIKTLRADAAMSLEQISTRTAETIDRELLDIQGDLEIVAAVYRDIFSNPQRYSVDPQSADFGITDKGTYIKTRDNGGSALFYSTAAPGYDRHKALITEAADPVMKQCKQGNPLIAAVYLNTWDSMNRYYPFMDVSIYDPHLEIPTFNFYYEADAAHNPERKPVWLSTYLDPAGQGWMISVITPIYRQDFLEGVLGIDITIDTIVSRVEQTDVPWGGYAMLVTGSGDVLALAGRGQEQLGMKLQAKHSYDAAVQQDTTINPENNLRKSSSRELNKLGDLVLGGDSSGRGEMIINGHNLLLSYKKISVSDIYLVVFVPTAEVFASSLRIERIARYVGYAAIAMMLLFYWLFFIMLKKRAAHMAEDVARPVAALESVAQQVGTGRLDIELPAAENRDEIGVLTEEFGRMVHNLRAAAAREEKYRKDLEMLAERLKAQNEELQVAYRAKDDLLNNMTHELVTPLNHINGYISMVLEGLYEDEAERDSYLNTALSGANELLTIVRNVVDLCAVEGQKLAVSKTPVNLRALVDEVCGQFAARAGQKQLKLTVEDRLDGNEVWTSADTLKKILAQLLDNAVKFTDQGQITVRLRTDGEGRPVIAVEDSGIGIAEGTDTAKLFDKFQQGDIGLNKEYGGAGLGLTVAGAFAGLIGAELALHSPGRGRGTVATIRL